MQDEANEDIYLENQILLAETLDSLEFIHASYPQRDGIVTLVERVNLLQATPRVEQELKQILSQEY